MPPHIAYLGGIAFIAGLIQGFTGFGVVLVALPLMVLLIDIKTAIPLVLLLGMVINLMLTGQLVRHFETQKWLPLLVAALPGIPLGIWTLKTVGARPLEIMVGVVILLTVAGCLGFKQAGQEHHRFWAWAAGLASGFLGGSIGAAGPPVVIYTALQPWTKEQVKGTMVAFFALSGLGIIGLHLYSGLITATVWRYWAYCLLPLVLGVGLGMRLYSRSNEMVYRRAVLILLAMLGLTMLFK